MTSALPPDDVLVARLRARDEASFAALLDAWSPGMLRLARSFVSTNASAEEVVQETWLAVLQGLHNFQGRAALKTWVFRIMVNIAKARGGKERRTIPLTSLQAEDEGPTVDPSRFRPDGVPYAGHWEQGQAPQPWPLPEDHALAGEIRQVIAAALAELPPRHRAVITMRDVAGYPAEEVCALLEITPGNQRVLLHRARAAVRGRLEEYFATKEGDPPS